MDPMWYVFNCEVPVLNPGYNPFSSLLGPEAHGGPMGVKP